MVGGVRSSCGGSVGPCDPSLKDDVSGMGSIVGGIYDHGRVTEVTASYNYLGVELRPVSRVLNLNS